MKSKDWRRLSELVKQSSTTDGSTVPRYVDVDQLVKLLENEADHEAQIEKKARELGCFDIPNTKVKTF